MIVNKNIHSMGPLVYVLPRALLPNSLETALSSHAKLEGHSSRKNVVSLNTLGSYCKGTNNSYNEFPVRPIRNAINSFGVPVTSNGKTNYSIK